jgi:hypothetical protein
MPTTMSMTGVAPSSLQDPCLTSIGCVGAGDLPAIIGEGADQGLVLPGPQQARHRSGTQADGFLNLPRVTLPLGGIAEPDTLRAVSYLAGTQDGM